jgi:hypothetical protein
MADTRRQRQLALLGNLKEKHRELKERARMHLDTLESATFVVECPLMLDGPKIQVVAKQLNEVIGEARELQGRIDELEEALGL